MGKRKNTLKFNNQYKHRAAHQSVLYPCIITLWARVASEDGQTEHLPTYGIQTPGSGFNRHIAAQCFDLIYYSAVV